MIPGRCKVCDKTIKTADICGDCAALATFHSCIDITKLTRESLDSLKNKEISYIRAVVLSRTPVEKQPFWLEKAKTVTDTQAFIDDWFNWRDKP